MKKKKKTKAKSPAVKPKDRAAPKAPIKKQDSRDKGKNVNFGRMYGQTEKPAPPEEDVGEEWEDDTEAIEAAPPEEAPPPPAESYEDPATLYDEPCAKCGRPCSRTTSTNLVFGDVMLNSPMQVQVIELLAELADDLPEDFGKWAKPTAIYHPPCWCENGRPGDPTWKAR